MARDLDSIDASIELEGGRLSATLQADTDGGVLAEGWSAQAHQLDALAKHLVSDSPIVIASAFDVQRGAEEGLAELERALAEVPLAARERLLEAYTSVMAFLGAYGPGVVMHIDPSLGGMHAALILRTETPRESRVALGDLLSSLDLDSLGFELTLPTRSRVGRASVEDYTFRFDTRRIDFDTRARMRDFFEVFLGSADLHMKVAVSGKETMIMLGGDTDRVDRRVRDFTREREVPADISAALETLKGANPSALWRFDLLRLVTLGDELTAITAGVSPSAARREALNGRDAGDGVPVLAWGGTREDSLFGGMSVDLDGLERALEILRPEGR